MGAACGCDGGAYGRGGGGSVVAGRGRVSDTPPCSGENVGIR